MKGQKKIDLANSHQKIAGVTVLISDKIDFKSEKVIRHKERLYILIKGSIHQEDKTDICTPKDRQSKHTQQKLTEPKGEIDSFTIRVESVQNQKISEEIEDSRNTNQLDITDIHRPLSNNRIRIFKWTRTFSKIRAYVRPQIKSLNRFFKGRCTNQLLQSQQDEVTN